jgi:two-component system chemotaxis response regulator CheY
MKIMIVDDSTVSRGVVRTALAISGYREILEAPDGEAALEVARQNWKEIGLYLLDINMPKMDGLTLLAELRKFDRNNPVIMLTTETEKEKIDKARSMGATGWIVKPFDAQKLIAAVNMVLKK